VVFGLARMRDFSMPLYAEAAEGPPQGALALRGRLEWCDAFVISSPEYNASVPGVLKNAIDWVSRIQPQPFKTKHALLASASPSLIGGNRGLWALAASAEKSSGAPPRHLARRSGAFWQMPCGRSSTGSEATHAAY
jgi:putative NADPH-quinone reductase